MKNGATVKPKKTCPDCGQGLSIVYVWSNGQRIVYRVCPSCDTFEDHGYCVVQDDDGDLCWCEVSKA